MAEDPGELLAEAASGPRPALTVKALVWITVTAAGLLLTSSAGVLIWFGLDIKSDLKEVQTDIKTQAKDTSDIKVSIQKVADNGDRTAEGLKGLTSRVDCIDYRQSWLQSVVLPGYSAWQNRGRMRDWHPIVPNCNDRTN